MLSRIANKPCWEGSFYPIGMRSKDFLRHYSSQFQTVEIDSTFYGTPAASTVTNWNEKTPQDFIFAVKTPQIITHEKVLVDCGSNLEGISMARSDGKYEYLDLRWINGAFDLSWGYLRPVFRAG